MGRETTLQAFPANWQPWAAADSVDKIGDRIQSVFCFLGWLRRKQRQTNATEYFAQENETLRRGLYLETLKLLKDDPALLWRYADLDRRFEVLLYLLLKVTTIPDQQDLLRFAISGRETVHSNAIAGQGFPIKWNDSETTMLISDSLKRMEFADLAKHFATETYMRQSLYKKSTDRRELTMLHSYFCQMKEYYRSAAASKNVTIVLVD